MLESNEVHILIEKAQCIFFLFLVHFRIMDMKIEENCSRIVNILECIIPECISKV